MNMYEIDPEIELKIISDSKAVTFPGLEYALIGYGQQNLGIESIKYYAIYSYNKIIEVFMERDRMTYDEAVEYFNDNTFKKGGKNYPVIYFEFR